MPSEPTSAVQQGAPGERKTPAALLPTLIVLYSIAGLYVLFGMFSNTGWIGIGLILALIAIIGLAILVHELGHLIAGWLMGFRFMAITVLGVQLYQKDHKLGLRWHWEGKTLGSARMCARRVVRLRRRQLIILAGGIAANALSLPIAFAVGAYVPFPAFVFVIVSFILIADSALPASKISDGSRIDTLLSNRQKARRYLAIVALYAQIGRGERPQNWKRTWLRTACSIPDGSADDLFGNQLGYIAAKARNNTNSARIHLEACVRISQLDEQTLLTKMRLGKAIAV